MYKVFIAVHDAHWIGPGKSIVVAKSREQARYRLKKELIKVGLDPKEGIRLREIRLDKPYAEVLWDGDY